MPLKPCSGGCGTIVVAPTAICSDCRIGKRFRGPRGEVPTRRPKFLTLPLSPTAKTPKGSS